jgi:hypothetical protein
VVPLGLQRFQPWYSSRMGLLKLIRTRKRWPIPRCGLLGAPCRALLYQGAETLEVQASAGDRDDRNARSKFRRVSFYHEATDGCHSASRVRFRPAGVRYLCLVDIRSSTVGIRRGGNRFDTWKKLNIVGNTDAAGNIFAAGTLEFRRLHLICARVRCSKATF